jgi:hypothetical protein
MSIVLLKEYFDTSFMDGMFVLKIIAITMITWLPLHMIYFITEACDPSEHKKIIME